MESVLLWYDKYSNTLKSHGFMVNPYDMFIANSTIKVNQCTLAWYVDDKKLSQIDEEVDTKVI